MWKYFSSFLYYVKMSLDIHKRVFLKRPIIFVILLIIAALFAAVAFYIPLCGNSFYGDDTQVIWFAATKTTGEIFFSPENYRALSGAFFQPMLGLSFKIDWLLSGLDPKGYYIHNLLSVLFTAAAIYIFLKLYTGALPALAGSVLFLLSPVTISLFSYSTNRHYVEGMFFAILTLYFYVKNNRGEKTNHLSSSSGNGGRWGLLILSAGSFLFSALSKEVYVLLPAIAFLISGGNIAKRFRSTFHLWVILCLYFIWRVLMIGGIGGYPFDDLLTVRKITAGIYNLLANMPQFLFGHYSFIFWIILSAMIITAQRRNLVKTGMIVIVLLLPVLPVLTMLALDHAIARYVFHLSVFLIFTGIVWGSETMKQRGWKRILAVSMLITVSAFFVIEDNGLKQRLSRDSIAWKKTTEEFLYSGREYVKARQPAWFYEGLGDIHEYSYGKKIRTKIVPEDNLIRYMSEERRKEIQSAGYNVAVKNGIEIRKDVIHGTIRLDAYTMQWDFKPYTTGRYLILKGRFSGLYDYMTPVKKKGRYLFGKYYPDSRPDLFFMRVVYQSTEGWEGISDEYRVEVPGTYSIELK